MCHVCCFDGRCQNQGFGFGIRAPPLLYNVLVIWKGDGKRLKYVYIYISTFEKEVAGGSFSKRHPKGYDHRTLRGL